MEAEPSEALSKSRFKPAEIQVDNSDPFLNDKLNRQSEIENLSNLLINSEAPLVLAVDAAWGSGKTTFLKMWKAYLSKEYASYATIYFSAWETDLSEDPLYVFLGEISSQLTSVGTGVTRIKWEKAITLAGQITKRSLPALAKFLTYGALDFEDPGIERTLADLSGEVVSDTLNTYKASVTAIQQFKVNLADVLTETGNDNPIIVFIDELDRCRPQYAIALLERIKHLLNLPGLIFVLGIDRSQLANAICGVYGDRFDSETYLQRFIDLDYRLAFGNSQDFVSKIITDYGLNVFFRDRSGVSNPYVRTESTHLVEACVDVATLFDLSLREVEQLLARVNIVARSTSATQPIYPHLLVGLLALRSKAFDQYSRLVCKTCSSVDFINLITQKWLSAPLKSADKIGFLVACVVQALSGGQSSDPGYAFIAAQSTATTGVSAREKELMAAAATCIGNISDQPSMRIHLEGLVNRIEMAQSFLV